VNQSSLKQTKVKKNWVSFKQHTRATAKVSCENGTGSYACRLELVSSKNCSKVDFFAQTPTGGKAVQEKQCLSDTGGVRPQHVHERHIGAAYIRRPFFNELQPLIDHHVDLMRRTPRLRNSRFPEFLLPMLAIDTVGIVVGLGQGSFGGARTNSTTVVKLPSRTASWVRSAKKRSTRFS